MRRHTRNKKSDPFLELPNDVNIAEKPNPRRPKGESGDDDKGDSLFVDVRTNSRTPTGTL